MVFSNLSRWELRWPLFFRNFVKYESDHHLYLIDLLILIIFHLVQFLFHLAEHFVLVFPCFENVCVYLSLPKSRIIQPLPCFLPLMPRQWSLRPYFRALPWNMRRRKHHPLGIPLKCRRPTCSTMGPLPLQFIVFTISGLDMCKFVWCCGSF